MVLPDPSEWDGRNGKHTSGVEPTMRIDVWSDVVCPWCYIGKRRLESAIADFEHGNEVEVVWHSFQLDPSAPREASGETVPDNHERRRQVDVPGQGLLDRR